MAQMRAGTAWLRTGGAIAISLSAWALAQPEQTTQSPASPPGAPPTSTPVKTPGTMPAVVPQPAATADAALDNLRLAVGKLRSLAYRVTASGMGAMNRPGPTHDATVHLERTPSSWRIKVEGTVTSAAGNRRPASKETPATKLLAAYDGVAARVIDDEKKQVHELATKDLEEVRTFLSTHMAATPVVWELLASKILELDGKANATLLAPETVDGVACDVVMIVPGKGGGAEDDQPMRLALAQTDKLPRRIELLRAARAGSKNPPQVVRTVTLSEVQPGYRFGEGHFVVETPDGYTIKPVTGRGGGERPGGTPRPAKQSTLPESAEGVLAAGTAAPPFNLKDPEGKAWTLDDYKGKVLVIDFWGSWCPPCRAAMPALQRVHDKFKDKNVAVVGFNYERNAKADPVKFKKDNGYDYQLLLKGDSVANKYKVQGWPTFYVIGADGKVLWGDVGLPGVPGVAQPTTEQYVAQLEANLTAWVEEGLRRAGK